MMKNSGWRSWLFDLIFFLMLGLISLTISFNIHKAENIFSWKSEIWADRGGYYIYLPAFFMYKMDIKQAPETIDEKTGWGFTLDYKKNKIETKYTCGVAILVSPFFVTTHFISKVFHIPEDRGFSPLYHRMTDVAAICYLILGLLMLSRFLKYYFKKTICYLILLFVYFGTNLLYYTVDDPMMSHVYSFFLFSGFLLFFKKFLEEKKYIFFLLLSLFMALIVLVRPTNLLIFSLFFLWDLHSWKDLQGRIKVFFKPVYCLSFLLIFFLVFLPQLLYWKYLHGSYLFYSYGSEGFSNWQHPKFPEIWFSTLNGLFLYSPLVLLFIAGIIVMIRKKMNNGILLLGLFMILSYVIASWSTWYYGCSFGQRSYVEYFSIFSVPFGFLLTGAIEKKKKLLNIFLLLLIPVFIYFNLRLMFHFEKCFFGSAWDWDLYTYQLEKAGLYKRFDKTFVFNNDFENVVLTGGNRISKTESKSGLQSIILNRDEEFCCKYIKHLWDFTEGFPRKAVASIWIFNRNPLPTHALLVCSIEKEGVSLLWSAQPLDPSLKTGQWSQVNASFDIPDGLESSTVVVFYVWNRMKTNFLVDDLSVKFEK